jgi:predicted Ser/Thr protein kinase
MVDTGKPRGISDILAVAESVEKRFLLGRRVLSFEEYLELFAQNPRRYARDASRYLRDVFDHYGTREVKYPWGEFTRFRLFDLPWEKEPTSGAARRFSLVGQEHVQEEIYRALCNFAREGRPNRLILMHGPNGSAKSTIVSCIMRALENYSSLDEGAVYQYSWVFPSNKTVRGALGFTGAAAGEKLASYAHLPDDQLDAKLIVEVRDHPLFLIPVAERRAMLEKLAANDGVNEPLPDWILRGELSHKSQQIFEALLASYKGSYTEVLKHVQVERYFISQRYRVGAVTVGPQMSVDAAERQVTADRSLSSLPPSLQALSLYEAKGELVDAAGGIIEFSDLLKRPLDAFKYLQLSVETGEVSLVMQNVQLNCVMIGSANELHLDAFREHPEFASFRGRFELVRVPYLRSYKEEQALYDSQVAPQVQRHVSPHATETAAMFAVLTRMRKATIDRYERGIGAALSGLTAVEKMDLYAHGRAPERLEPDQQKLLRAHVKDVYQESDSYPIYEGRVGASPREMRGVLLDAAQSDRYECLSPLAVLEEIERLCNRKSEFEWLQQETQSGGYHDTKLFREALSERLLGVWEQELYAASGFVDEQQYGDLFEKYVQHVSVWVKKERVLNRITGEYEEPDAKMMKEVERLLDVKGEADEWRKQMISTIAAWAIDHPGDRVETTRVFSHLLKRMREAIFADKRVQVAKLARNVVEIVRDERTKEEEAKRGPSLDAHSRAAAQEVLVRLEEKFGYCRKCAGDMMSMLVRKRLFS